MSFAALALAAAVVAPSSAGDQPDQEARSAMGACLAAIIDRAPVADVKGVHVEIRREINPGSCTVRVDAGTPSEIRAAVVEAITRRREAFTPAKTAWDPAGFASRETFCNSVGRRALNILISTAKPGEPLSLIATVFEAHQRDERCDRDQGLQPPLLHP